MELSLHPNSDDIEEELRLIAREVEHLAIVLKRHDVAASTEPDSQQQWETATLCASAIEKIYTGCERVMAKLAVELDGEKISKTEGWHRALLDRMKLPFPGRGAILTGGTFALLDRMRAFRHRERNTYGFDLDTDIVLDRAREVIRAYNGLAADVRRVLSAH